MILAWILLLLSLFCQIFIFLYSLVQLNLLFNYLKVKNKKQNDLQTNALLKESNWPLVTVQLPVYNEMYVVERLIDSVIKLDYPKDKLEIQVLDDSDDESFEIAAKKVSEYQKLGFDIKHIKRPTRIGYKAGALAFGLKEAKGEFCAIFDADFVPNTDFLLKAMPWFSDDSIAMVQTRWGHLNKNNSLLTRLQAFGLDAHFTIEQVGRQQGGHFFNFNGTAGIWRVKAIIDAGGWSADTLTEDLDLSYRVQLKGWRFHYLEELNSPAELPVVMSAIKSQQYRWNKGAAECARKNLGAVLRNSKIILPTKIHAFFHLLNSGIFLAVFFYSFISIPLMLFKAELLHYDVIYYFRYLFLVALLILGAVYFVSMQKGKNRFIDIVKFTFLFPAFLAMSMGLSFHNAMAVLSGYFNRKSPFIRTPKFGSENVLSLKMSRYFIPQLKPEIFIEGFLAIYFSMGIVIQFSTNDLLLLPLHLLLVLGFGLVFAISLNHAAFKSGF